MVFLATKAALAATIVGIGVTFGALSYLARRNQENGLQGSSNINYDASGSNRGLPSFLFPQSSKEPPLSSASPPEGGSSRPLFPGGGFRLFGASSSSSPSSSSSSFLRDCNCKVIHECSTFSGGASHSFRLRRTCGFQGFQRKICCDDRPTYFSTPPPHFALDEMKSAHAHLNTNSNGNCHHNHGTDGSTNSCNCDHNHDFDDSNKSSGSKTQGSFRDEVDSATGEDATTTASRPLQVQGGIASTTLVVQDEEQGAPTTTSRPRLKNFPDLAEYFRDDEKMSSTQVPLETLFPNDDADDVFKGRNDRIDALFGEHGEKSTEKSTLDDDSSDFGSSIKFPGLNEYFPGEGGESESSKYNTAHSDTTTSTTEVIPPMVESVALDDEQFTQKMEPSTSEASTTTTTATSSTTEDDISVSEERDAEIFPEEVDDAAEGKSSDSPSSTTEATTPNNRDNEQQITPMSPVLPYDDDMDIIEVPETTTVKKVVTSRPSFNEEFPDVTESIIRGSGAQKPQSLEFEHSLVSESPAPPATVSLETDISSSEENRITTTTSHPAPIDMTVTTLGNDISSSTVSNDRHPLSLSGVHKQPNDFNERVTTVNSIMLENSEEERVRSSSSTEVPNENSSVSENSGSSDTEQVSQVRELLNEDAEVLSSTVPSTTTDSKLEKEDDSYDANGDLTASSPGSIGGDVKSEKDILQTDAPKNEITTTETSVLSNATVGSENLENSSSPDSDEVLDVREILDEDAGILSSTVSSDSKLEGENTSFDSNVDLATSSPSSIGDASSEKDILETDVPPLKDVTTSTEPASVSIVEDDASERIETTDRSSSFTEEPFRENENVKATTTTSSLSLEMVTGKSEIIHDLQNDESPTSTLPSKQPPVSTEPSTTVPDGFIMNEYANTSPTSTERVLPSSQEPEISTTLQSTRQDNEENQLNIDDRNNDHLQTTTVASLSSIKDRVEITTMTNMLMNDDNNQNDSTMSPLVEHTITTTIKSLLGDLMSVISSMTTPSPPEDAQDDIQVTTVTLDELKRTTASSAYDNGTFTTESTVSFSEKNNVEHQTTENEETEGDTMFSTATTLSIGERDDRTKKFEEIQVTSTPSPLQRGGDYSEEDYRENELPTGRKVATPSTGQAETNSINDFNTDSLTLKSTTIMSNDTNLTTEATLNEGDTFEPEEEAPTTTSTPQDNEVTAGTLKIIELPATTPLPKITTTTMQSTTIDNVGNEQTTTKIGESSPNFNERLAPIDDEFDNMDSSTANTEHEFHDMISTPRTDVSKDELFTTTSVPVKSIENKEENILMSDEEATPTTSSKPDEMIRETTTEELAQHDAETTTSEGKATQAITSTSASSDLSITEIPTTIYSTKVEDKMANDDEDSTSISTTYMNDDLTTTSTALPSTLRTIELSDISMKEATITTTMEIPSITTSTGSSEDDNNDIPAEDDTSAELITTQSPSVMQINEERQTPVSLLSEANGATGETAPSTTEEQTTTSHLADDTVIPTEDATSTKSSVSPNAGETTSRTSTTVTQTTLRFDGDFDISTRGEKTTTQKTAENTMSSVTDASTEAPVENDDNADLGITQNPVVLQINQEGQTPVSLLKDENDTSEAEGPTTMASSVSLDAGETETTSPTIVAQTTSRVEKPEISPEGKAVTMKTAVEIPTTSRASDIGVDATTEKDDSAEIITTAIPRTSLNDEDNFSSTPISVAREENVSFGKPEATTLASILMNTGETTLPSNDAQTTSPLLDDSESSVGEKAVTMKSSAEISTTSRTTDLDDVATSGNDDVAEVITTTQNDEDNFSSTPISLVKKENALSDTRDITTMLSVSLNAADTETTSPTTIVQTTLRADKSEGEKTVTMKTPVEVSTTSGILDFGIDATTEKDDAAEILTTFNPSPARNEDDHFSSTPMSSGTEEKVRFGMGEATTLSSVSISSGETETTSTTSREEKPEISPEEKAVTMKTTVEVLKTNGIKDLDIEATTEQDGSAEIITTFNSITARNEEDNFSSTTLASVSLKPGESYSTEMVDQTTLRLSDDFDSSSTEKSSTSKTSTYIPTTNTIAGEKVENDDTTEFFTTSVPTLNDEFDYTPASAVKEEPSSSVKPVPTTMSPISMNSGESVTSTMVAQTTVDISDDFDTSATEKAVTSKTSTNVPTTTKTQGRDTDNEGTTESPTTLNPSIIKNDEDASTPVSLVREELPGPTTMQSVSLEETTLPTTTSSTSSHQPVDSDEQRVSSKTPTEMPTTTSRALKTDNEVRFVNDDPTEFVTTFPENPSEVLNEDIVTTPIPLFKDEDNSSETPDSTTLSPVSLPAGEATLSTTTVKTTTIESSGISTGMKSVTSMPTTEMATTMSGILNTGTHASFKSDDTAKVVTTLNPSIIENGDEEGSTTASLTKEEKQSSDAPGPSTLSPVSLSDGETTSPTTGQGSSSETEMSTTTTSGESVTDNGASLVNDNTAKIVTTLNPSVTEDDREESSTTLISPTKEENGFSETLDRTTLSPVSSTPGETTLSTTSRLLGGSSSDIDMSTISTNGESITDSGAGFISALAEMITTLNPFATQNYEEDATPESLIKDNVDSPSTPNSIEMPMNLLQNEIPTSTEMESPTTTQRDMIESIRFMNDEVESSTATETPTTINPVVTNARNEDGSVEMITTPGSDMQTEEKNQTPGNTTPSVENLPEIHDSTTTMTPASLHEDNASTEMSSPTTTQREESVKTVTTTTETPMTSMKSNDLKSEDGTDDNVGFMTTLKTNYEDAVNAAVSNDENNGRELTTEYPASTIATNSMVYMEEMASTPAATAVPMMIDEILMGEDGLPITEITKSIRREPDTDKTVVELRAMSSEEKNKVGKTVTAERSGSEATVSELTTESPVSTTFTSLEQKTTFQSNVSESNPEYPMSMNEMDKEEDSTVMSMDSLEATTTMETATVANLMRDDDMQQNKTEMLQGRTAGRGVPLPISHASDLLQTAESTTTQATGNVSSSTASTDTMAPTTTERLNETLEMNDDVLSDELNLMITIASSDILSDTASETVKLVEMESTTQFDIGVNDGVESLEIGSVEEISESSTTSSKMVAGTTEKTESITTSERTTPNESTTPSEGSQVLTINNEIKLNKTTDDIPSTTTLTPDEITTELYMEHTMGNGMKNGMIEGVSIKSLEMEMTTLLDIEGEATTTINTVQNDDQMLASLSNENVPTMSGYTTTEPPAASTMQEKTNDTMSKEEMISTTAVSNSPDISKEEIGTSTVETMMTGQGETISEEMSSQNTDRPSDTTVIPSDGIMKTTTNGIHSSTPSSSIDSETSTQAENDSVQDMTTLSSNTTPKHSSSTETILSDEEIMNTGSTMPSFSDMTTDFAFETTTEVGSGTIMNTRTTPSPKLASRAEDSTTSVPRSTEPFETTTENDGAQNDEPDYDISRHIEVEPPTFDTFETNTFSPPCTHDLSKSNDSLSTTSYYEESTTLATKTEMNSSTDKTSIDSTTSSSVDRTTVISGEAMQTTMNVSEDREVITEAPSMSIVDINESEENITDTTTQINRMPTTTQKETEDVENTTTDQLMMDLDESGITTTSPTELDVTTLPNGESTTVLTVDKIERTTTKGVEIEGTEVTETISNDEMVSTTSGSRDMNNETATDMLETTTAETLIVQDETTELLVTEQATEKSEISGVPLQGLELKTTTVKADEAVTQGNDDLQFGNMDEVGDATTSLQSVEVAYESSTRENMMDKDMESTTTAKLHDVEASSMLAEQPGIAIPTSPSETHASYAATTEYPDTADMITTTDTPTINESIPLQMDDVEETSTPGPTAVPMMIDEIMMGEDGLPITEITKSVRREPDTDKTVVELRYMLSKEKNKVGKTVTAEKSGSEATVSELTTESPVSTTTTFSLLEQKTTTDNPLSMIEMDKEEDSTLMSIDSLEAATTVETATGANLMLDDMQQNETEMLQGRTAGRVPLQISHNTHDFLQTAESTTTQATGNVSSSTAFTETMAPTTTERLNETLGMNDDVRSDKLDLMTTTASSGIIEMTETVKPMTSSEQSEEVGNDENEMDRESSSENFSSMFSEDVTTETLDLKQNDGDGTEKNEPTDESAIENITFRDETSQVVEMHSSRKMLNETGLQGSKNDSTTPSNIDDTTTENLEVYFEGNTTDNVMTGVVEVTEMTEQSNVAFREGSTLHPELIMEDDAALEHNETVSMSTPASTVGEFIHQQNDTTNILETVSTPSTDTLITTTSDDNTLMLGNIRSEITTTEGGDQVPDLEVTFAPEISAQMHNKTLNLATTTSFPDTEGTFTETLNDTDIPTQSTIVETISTTLESATYAPVGETTESQMPAITDKSSTSEFLDEVPTSTEPALAVTEPNYQVEFNSDDFNETSSMPSIMSANLTEEEEELPTTEASQNFETTLSTAALQDIFDAFFGSSSRSGRVNNLGSDNNNKQTIVDADTTTVRTTTTPEPPFKVEVKVGPYDDRSHFSSDITPVERQLEGEISNVVTQLLLTTHPNFKLLPNFVECAGARGRTGRRKTKVLHFDTENYPWMARVGFKEPGGVIFPCAGTIISRRYILTSAHCALRKANGTASIMEILLEGAKNAAAGMSDQSQYKYKVEQVLPHPNYDRKTRENDLALIRLATEIPPFNGSSEVKPICLPFEDGYGVWDSLPTEGETAYLGGWGYGLKNMAATVEEMEEAAVTIWSNQNCSYLYRGDREKIITPKHICAYGKAEKDACRGDFGGPLMALMTRQKIFFQIGVVSYGPRCGYGVPGVYTRVSNYLTWILDAMQP